MKEKKKVGSFKELKIWKKAKELVINSYKLTEIFPEKEKFIIIPQMNRAALSIMANIAEGWGRDSKKEYLYFLNVAKGSLFELDSFIEVSYDLKYISLKEREEILIKVLEIKVLLIKTIKKLKEKL
ncbi:MAG: four helix bundle protein [Candidatus Muiribacteriota bacterium]